LPSTAAARCTRTEETKDDHFPLDTAQLRHRRGEHDRGAASVRSIPFPARPIRLIIGFPAGGITDIVMRAAAAEAEKKFDAFKFAIEQPSMIAPLDKSDQAPRDMNTQDFRKFVEQSFVEQRGLLTKYGMAKKR
jgi:tripartite-type tricarboxylate transporter receptor subunit TctC